MFGCLGAYNGECQCTGRMLRTDSSTRKNNIPGMKALVLTFTFTGRSHVQHFGTIQMRFANTTVNVADSTR